MLKIYWEARKEEINLNAMEEDIDLGAMKAVANQSQKCELGANARKWWYNCWKRRSGEGATQKEATRKRGGKGVTTSDTTLFGKMRHQVPLTHN